MRDDEKEDYSLDAVTQDEHPMAKRIREGRERNPIFPDWIGPTAVILFLCAVVIAVF